MKSPTVAACLAGALAGALLVPAQPARADSPDLGGLSYSPGVGQDITPIHLTTLSSTSPKGCPSSTTAVTGIATGPGGWSGGLQVVGNTSAGISTTDDFSVDMSNSFKGTADDNGTVLTPGKYTIVLTCQNKLGNTQYGHFSGSVWFTDATHYQSTDPASSSTATTTALGTDPTDRQQVGRPVTLTATVTPASAQGKVQFRDTRDNNVTAVGSPATLAGGTATVTTSSLEVGLHTLSAVFSPAPGDRSAPSTSPGVTLVIAQPDPPTANGPATLSGDPRIGRQLSCSASFSGADSTDNGWLRDGALIGGATAAQYTVVPADVRHRLACRVSAHNAGGTVYRDSDPVSVAPGDALRPSTRPSIAGRARPGNRLSARVGSWAPVATGYRLQWRRDGRAIPGATGGSFALTTRDAGHRLSLVVVARRAGYLDGTYVTGPVQVARR